MSAFQATSTPSPSRSSGPRHRPAGSPLLRSVPAFAGLPPCHRHGEFASRTGCSPPLRRARIGALRRRHAPLSRSGYCPSRLPFDKLRIASQDEGGFAFAHDSLPDPGFAGRASWIAVREAGRMAVPLGLNYTARRPRPAGDFCPRPFRSAQILFALRHWPLGYVLVQHAPPVVAAGEPLNATSPAP
jgi:hypothetical protein